MSYLAIAKRVEVGLKSKGQDELALAGGARDGLTRVAVAKEDNLVLGAWIVEEIRAAGGSIEAVKIYSAILRDHLWVIFDRRFRPKEGLAIYYIDELLSLGNKTQAELREIHKVKLAFPGCRVIQEGPEKSG